MRTIVHLSDLHFGRVDLQLLSPLVEAVEAAAPDVVVVSGDLTQRARSRQFVQAREFLARLPSPQVVVPGNHDVPLYNLFRRFARPFEGFRRHIEPNLLPSYVDDEIAVLGINTARALALKNGRVSAHQLDRLRQLLGRLPHDLVKVIVTHHPFDAPASRQDSELVGGAREAMQEFARCGVDLLLAGHLHASHGVESGERHALAGYEALAISAGTASSTRGRGEANSFNVLRLHASDVDVERHEWDEGTRRFRRAAVQRFRREGTRWREMPSHAAGRCV